MSKFDDLIAGVNNVCVDILGDMEGTLTDGVVPAAAVVGFFREEFTQALSDQYAFIKSTPTFECKASAIAAFDRTKIKTNGWKYRPVDRSFDYVVQDIHGPTKGMVLLELAAP